MKIIQKYSYFNGYEYLFTHQPNLWKEIIGVIEKIDVERCLTKKSKEKRKKGNVLISLKKLNNSFKQEFKRKVWAEIRNSYFVTEKVAIDVQFGKLAFIDNDFIFMHLTFFLRDEINVGIEILPMKSMQRRMSSGIGYYEGELYNILRHGRNIPAVPLVLIGIDI